MRHTCIVALAFAIPFSSCHETRPTPEHVSQGLAIRTRGSTVTIRYLLPATLPTGHVAATERGFAAPVVDGCSDPTQIVYDDAYVGAYIEWALTAALVDGAARYTIVTPDEAIEVDSGLDESYLGRRFRAEDLIRFLEMRASVPAVERTFVIDDPKLVRLMRENAASSSARRVRISPWDRDTGSILSLLGLARFAPAYPLFKRLIEDRSPPVRHDAVIALGRIAPVVPQALSDLSRLLTHKELGGVAFNALQLAGGAAVPVLIEAMDHPESNVRARAVFALPWIPFDAAAPAILVALDHRDAEVREWAVASVLDIQSRGVSVGRAEIIAALRRRLSDENANVRRRAAVALKNLDVPAGD